MRLLVRLGSDNTCKQEVFLFFIKRGGLDPWLQLPWISSDFKFKARRNLQVSELKMSSRVDTDEDSDIKGSMWDLDQKLDQPMDEEAGRLKNMYREKKFSALLLLRLSFQSLGVVYGDLGTSPLYVFYNTFPNGVKDQEDVIGALSLIIYSLTLVPLLKYVFVVLRANDNGQGGTFALYSLLCRHAKIKTLPNQHRTDEELTTYSRSTFHERSFAAKTKRWLEEQESARSVILILVLVGTCMVIGDGILTPAISGMPSFCS
ncbi:hypothetical protein V8G54_004358 [Vigna mungo]|uniref:K+ potassium transporter integral membrane domain-containing protein n=1 Tax=Vigna mungo TaxID=3915 RepID=A0AAQ3PF52_VIGMU